MLLTAVSSSEPERNEPVCKVPEEGAGVDGGSDDDGATTLSGAGGSGLMSDVFHPTDAKDQDEFRPFIRRLPEFKFWISATQAILVSLGATMFTVFDIPVFWPILVLYFATLFVITMRRQIEHMIRYKYLPFDMGRKARYGRH